MEERLFQLQPDAFAQADVGGGGAEQELGAVFRRDEGVGVAVPDFQVIGRNDQFDFSFLPFLQRESVEAAQTEPGIVAREADVKLDHFLAVTRTRVLQLETDDLTVVFLADFHL